MAYDVELADRLREILASEPEVTQKRMFGGLAFLVAGHMAVSASSQGGLLLRVDPAESDALTADPRASRFVMRGRAGLSCAGATWPAGCASRSTRARPTTS